MPAAIKAAPYNGPEAPPTVATSVIPVALNKIPGIAEGIRCKSSHTLAKPTAILRP